MALGRTIWLRLRALFDRDALNRELDDELRYHLEQETEANVRLGLTPEAAARRARLEFGAAEAVKEEFRSVRGDSIAEAGWQDMRFGLRMMRRNPAFTAVAVATLALGLGANSAMFSVVNAVILKPLPYADPDRLMRVIDSNPGRGFPRFSSSPANFLDWRAQAQSFTGMAATATEEITLSGQGDAARLHALFVTPDLFPVAGVTPAFGRAFTAEEG